MEAVALTGSTVPARHPDVSYRVYEGQAVVLVPATGEAKILNEVGARIWDLMDGRRDVDAIARTIQEEFEVDAAVAGADVCDFVQDLISHKMASVQA